ncbi:MAG: helix-turn-helix domain-containing protein [Burkholderiaceae bacterium]|nr:helix-turn-helix domain-containing protein [Burkholderiaceae bacterium]
MKLDEKLLLKEKEAAELLGMSTHFLRRDRISALPVGIPFMRIGASIRYRRAELEAWIADQMHRQSNSPKLRDLPPDSRNDEPRRRGRPKKTQRRSAIDDSSA